MYEEYLGKSYHEKIRKKITVDETLLPDSIIDADVNIGAMKKFVTPVLETMRAHGRIVDTEKKYVQLQSAALDYLCGIICVALKSRTSAPPYNTKEYIRDWDKKQDRFIRYANSQMMGLMRMG